MKKNRIIIPLLAALVAMVSAGCQKEQDVVNFGVVIGSAGDSKLFIDGLTPSWHNGDMVHINGVDYPVQNINGNTAQILGVATAENQPSVFSGAQGRYVAFYPASAVKIVNNYVKISLPDTQYFSRVGNHQRVEVPMVANTSGNTLTFHNICSVVRVKVKNDLDYPLDLRHITMSVPDSVLSNKIQTGLIVPRTVFTYYVAPWGDERDTIGNGSTRPQRATEPDNVDLLSEVTLKFPTAETIQPGDSCFYDIVAPRFSQQDVTITIVTWQGADVVTVPNATLHSNSITTIRRPVAELTDYYNPGDAYLVNGQAFFRAMPSTIEHITFECNAGTVSSDLILSTNLSPVPIYGIQEGSTMRVVTDASTMYANGNCAYMFGESESGYTPLSNLRSITFGEGFTTEIVRKMDFMFYRCESLTNLDLSSFNTERVLEMGHMFYGCKSLGSLNISNFSTTQVTDMKHMFEHCETMTVLTLGQSFSTANVTNMSHMFSDCHNLTNITGVIANFNTANVTDMSHMFQECRAISSLSFPSGFSTQSVTNMKNMFADCINLTSLDLSGFNTQNVLNMSGMFNNVGLSSIDLSSFNTSSVTDMSGMFRSGNITSITFPTTTFTTSNVTNMANMFGYVQIPNLDISFFNTSRVTNMSGMFYSTRCNTLNLSGAFTMSAVTNKSDMFLKYNYVGSGYETGGTIICTQATENSILEMSGSNYITDSENSFMNRVTFVISSKK